MGLYVVVRIDERVVPKMLGVMEVGREKRLQLHAPEDVNKSLRKTWPPSNLINLCQLRSFLLKSSVCCQPHSCPGMTERTIARNQTNE